MKFFSVALSAATIGSALASPILGSACSGSHASAINGDLVPSAVQTLTSATTLYQTWATTVSDSKTEYYSPEITTAVASALPTGTVDTDKLSSDATSGKAPAVVVKEVTTIVLNIDVLVKADLTRITELVDAEAGIDAQLLLEAIVSLSGHLNTVVTGVIPSITALIKPSVGLVAAELQIVLDLVADIESLLTQVESCLKHLIATATKDVLKVLLKELNVIAALILPIATPIVNFALRAVVGLSTQAPSIVAQITTHANSINKCAGGLNIFLGAALKVVL